MSDNADQIEYWNGETGERWARQQQRMDLSLSEILKRVLPFADARPGEHVLDVGCGCGTATLALAEAVGPTGTVTGIDISRPMLEVARRRADQAGAKITFREADASDYPFTPEYDLVFSRFGVMFFADSVAAFANIRKALKPGGRLRFVCWRSAAENLWGSAPLEAARPLLPPQEARDPNAPGPSALGDRARLHAILSEAGFREIGIEKFDTVMVMGSTPEEAANEALSVGPLARAVVSLNEDQRTGIRALVAEKMGAFRTNLGITPPAACWLVQALNQP